MNDGVSPLRPNREGDIPTPPQLKNLRIAEVSPAMETILSKPHTKEDIMENDGPLDDEEGPQTDETEVLIQQKNLVMMRWRNTIQSRAKKR